MLGHFLYSPVSVEGCINIVMEWTDRGAIGVLHFPSTVQEITAGTEFAEIRSGESLRLPIALGIGVIFGGLADIHLILSGERSAWKDNWGRLLDVLGNTSSH